ncbi:ABC transporter ATP-binding protein [Paenibacillus puerhi]|uniref:ABC transporter ATP-binding protein n=1 Tax=Paenibacillus puerhi TaxID=2692622 RepID=UPI00135A7BE3|nr:ABC transporter ATP-binding protein [Paenibacillus puerhi]
MHVEIRNVIKHYDSGAGRVVKALQDVSLSVEKAEFVCLLGPSGCGKSTLLKLIAGIETTAQGRILVDGRAVEAPSTERGFIFQDYALFPWLKVGENIRFGLEMKRMNKRQQNEIVEHYLRLLGLEQVVHLYPKELSGGMSQRVAIARALCLRPQLLLLDEPFAALDAILRQKLQEEMVRLWSKEKITFILVTHDVEEAIYLADRIIVMTPGPGRIKEIVPVPMPRPRTRTSLDFVQLRDRLFHLLQGEESWERRVEEERRGALQPILVK